MAGSRDCFEIAVIAVIARDRRDLETGRDLLLIPIRISFILRG